MPVHRSPVQGRQTLQAYYQAIADSKNPVDRLAGQQMLQLLAVLNNLFPQMPLWD